MLSGVEIKDPKSVPIVINNYNRLSYLEKLIDSLTSRGYHNIYIIDNKSTYPPLLEYYKNCPYKVYMLDENVGYLAMWQTDVYKDFWKSYYVYTDSDMQIDDLCPDDFMQKFLDILEKYPSGQKAGFALRIDDLPDCFRNKENVLQHEGRFWYNEVENGVYEAEIDTTFALYRPFCGGKADKYQKTYRTGFPYVIRHLPWYADSSSLSTEDEYYINTITQSTYWSQQK
jgi:glycosyltransferase involved in cell wall biosynthesis